VLLAEDNDANREVVADYLTSQGYAVEVARTGREALEQAGACTPQLILMDIQMPELDGLAVIKALRATPAFRTTPIVALTALALPGDRERCLAAGATAYVPKPLRLRQLVELIERLLEG
jgi:CheY-like chemotaxis protein